METPVALLGGTGKLGPGLAMRFARAGVPVIIGSRDASRGAQAAAEVSEKLRAAGGDFAPVEGTGNLDAAQRGRIAVITVPYEVQAALLPSLAEALAGKVVVSTAVPVSFDPASGFAHVDVPEGSAAQQAAALLPRSRVAGAFHNVSSLHLKRLNTPVEGDVIVTADDEDARDAALEMARLVPGVRVLDGGPLRCARYTEELTVLLLTVNRIHHVHSGVALTGLPPENES